MSSSIRPIQANTYDLYDNSGNRVGNPTRSIVTTGNRPVTGTQGDVYLDASGNAYWYKDASTGWINFNYSTPEITMGVTNPTGSGTIAINKATKKPIWYNGSTWATMGKVATVSNPPAYTPITTNLKAWFRASDLSGSSDLSGLKVKIWRNASPNKEPGSDMTMDPSGSGPWYEVSGGTPSVKFNTTGTNDRGYAIMTPVSGRTSSPNYAMFFVFSLDGKGSYDQYLKCTTTSTGNVNSLTATFNNGPVNFYVQKSDLSGASVQGNIISVTGNTYNYWLGDSTSRRMIISICGTNNCGSNAVYSNGTLVQNFSNGLTATQGMYLTRFIFGGGINATTDPCKIRLFECLIYYTDINDTERQKIEGYLAWNNGVVSGLYSGHPYKNAPPTA